MKKILVLFGILIGYMGVALTVSGAEMDGANANESYALGEVVISSPKKGVEAIGTTFRITAENIDKSGARSLDEALDLIPGVYVRNGGSGTPRIDIRGFRTRHVTLLLDGIPFNETYDGQFDPTTIPVEYIREIKVVTGGGSVLYGSGGNGGIINIITKKGIKGVNGEINGEAGSDNIRNAKFSLAAASDHFNAFISASSRQKDGFQVSDDFNPTADEGGNRRENSDSERISCSGSLYYSPVDTTVMGVSFNHLQGKNGIPPITNYDEDIEDPFVKPPKFERIDDINGNAVQASMDHQFDGPLRLRGWVYFNQQNLLENGYDKDSSYTTQEDQGSYSLDSTSQVRGVNLQAIYKLDRFGKTTIGVISESQKWEVDGFSVGRTRTDPVKDKKKDKVHSVAAEYEVTPMDKLNIVIGYGHHFQNKDEGNNESEGAYLVGATFDVFDTTQVKASYAKKIRFPSIRQLYDPKSGNDKLLPEQTFHYEIGLIQTFSYDTDVSLTLFHINAEDFIEKPEGGDTYLNYEEYQFRGFEIAATSKPVQGIALRASYSFLDSEDKSSGTQKAELQNRPKHKYGVEATYAFSFGFKVHMDFMRVTEQYFYDKDNTDPLLEKKLNDITVMNLKLSQNMLKDAVSVYLGADNLMDENYEQSYGLPQPGRAIYGGVTWRF